MAGADGTASFCVLLGTLHLLPWGLLRHECELTCCVAASVLSRPITLDSTPAAAASSPATRLSRAVLAAAAVPASSSPLLSSAPAAATLPDSRDSTAASVVSSCSRLASWWPSSAAACTWQRQGATAGQAWPSCSPQTGDACRCEEDQVRMPDISHTLQSQDVQRSSTAYRTPKHASAMTCHAAHTAVSAASSMGCPQTCISVSTMHMHNCYRQGAVPLLTC